MGYTANLLKNTTIYFCYSHLTIEKSPIEEWIIEKLPYFCFIWVKSLLQISFFCCPCLLV